MTLRSIHASTRTLVPLLLASQALLAGCATTSNDVSAADPHASSGMGGDAAHAAMQLPPGWTEADMQACAAAGTPGPMHQHLARAVGTWAGTNTMWMAPGMPPTTSTCTDTVTMEMDGRYSKVEFVGDVPGMGPFHGIGYNGYDNVSQTFVSTWIDSMSSGIMTGTGQLSPDGKTMTWSYTYSCPIRKRPATMRQIERETGDGAMTLEMYGSDPKTGVEYKMMQIDLKRTSKGHVGT